MSKYDDLVRKLKEIFQIDRPELDFGVYRILNARVGEINDYLESRLKAKVTESLSASGESNLEGLQRELKEKEVQYRGDGIDTDTVPKIKELRQKIADMGTGAADQENAVFTHLLTFFSRYYDKGDFISQRRYKGDTYAIPYAGEEVVLHWANKDQYYTKSGENFSNYGFKLDDGRTVRFRLIAADTAKDNRKDNDKERQFVLIERHTRTLTDEDGEEYEQKFLPVEEVNAELVIRFDYKAMPKGSKQDDLVGKAVAAILGDPIIKARWLDLEKREPTEKNPQRTLLEKCLASYTTKNSSDYFIHKDLAGFLHRELDFYIKNEVMHLDDVQHAEKFADIEKNLRMIQCLRSIAHDLIAFLSQLEDFQKKLWLKKKFVVSAHYCITLDRVPASLYSAIAKNPSQWEQWENLGMLEGKKDDLFKQAKTGTVDYLNNHPYLMVDSALFEDQFNSALLNGIENLDESIDGLLINGDNYQALNLLQYRFRGQVQCVYIDPPYNTSASEIIYKNSFKHSSWLCLMDNRISIGKLLMHAEDGFLCCTIDDIEQKVLSQLIESHFGEIAGTVAIRIKPSGRPIPNGFAVSHEYAIFARTNPNNAIERLDHSDEQAARYKEADDRGTYFWELFRKAGSNSNKSDRPSMHYPFYLEVITGLIRLPKGSYDSVTETFRTIESPKKSEIEVFPIKDDGSEGRWYFGYERAIQHAKEFKGVKNPDGSYRIYYRRRPNTGVQPTTNWFDSKYSATEHGTALLKALFGEQEVFSYPKSIHAVQDCLSVMGAGLETNAYVLDYFAGSGTTGHAVINLNRKDKGSRKYLLVEQGDYFDTVTKPRIQKVAFSADWKAGNPTTPETGISHAFKVLKLESYEDTLNNLHLIRSQAQTNLIDSLPQSAKEDYLLRYMLDIESRGSLLNVEQFSKPFDYKLKVSVDSAGAYEEQTIDLVETFNYLIGLRVKHIDMQLGLGFVSVTGFLPSGEKTLVLWRDVEKLDYEGLNRVCEKLAINPADSEFEVVYINGDHNIPAVFTSTEAEGGITKTLKIRQIEPEFLSRMFSVEA